MDSAITDFLILLKRLTKGAIFTPFSEGRSPIARNSRFHLRRIRPVIRPVQH